ncbi:MAG: MFS transporter [Chloroflexi bacterium]|nr:MFS transporter [Chloroflexota bacterium]
MAGLRGILQRQYIQRRLLALYLPWVLAAIAQGLILPVLPLHAKELGASFAWVGLVVAGQGIGTLLADLPTSLLLHRFSFKTVALLGLIVIMITRALLFFAPTIAIVLVLCILAGAGRAMFFISQTVYVTDTVAPRRRGRAIAIFGGLMRMGVFIGPVIGGFMGAWLGLRSVFLLNSLLIALALVTFAYLMPTRSKAETQAARAVHHHSLWRMLRQYAPLLRAAGLGQILAMLTRYGRMVIIPLYANEQLGLGVEFIGLIETFSYGLDMMLFYPAGWVMDRLGRKYAIIPSFVAQGFGLALIPLVASASGILFVAALLGIGNGIGSGTMMTLGSDLAPADARGDFLGVWRFIGDFGMVGGPLVVGNLADLFTLGGSALLLAAASFSAAGIFGLFVPETLRRKRLAPASSG